MYVDVMAVCWLKISGADVSLPHLTTILCRTMNRGVFLFCFTGFTMLSSIFHEAQKTACLSWKMNGSTTNKKLLISGRSLITLSSRGALITSCFCKLVLWTSQEFSVENVWFFFSLSLSLSLFVTFSTKGKMAAALLLDEGFDGLGGTEGLKITWNSIHVWESLKV